VEVQASIPGIFRTVLIIIGAIVLLRFLGQLMIAKRNMEEERNLSELQRKSDQERAEKMKKFGKTTILGKVSSNRKSNSVQSNVEDVDYEEIQ
jgi:hypothetical protein